MRVVVDTNIIVRNANRDDAQHSAVAGRLRGLVASGAELCIAAQSVFEFWVVATRPRDVNGLGLPPAEARDHVRVVLDAFVLLGDPADLLVRGSISANDMPSAADRHMMRASRPGCCRRALRSC